MKKFIILPITIFVCYFLLGSTIETVNSNTQSVAYAAASGIYTSTDELKPIEEDAMVVVLSLEQEERTVPVVSSYEVFVTEILYTQEEIEYLLSTREGFLPYASTFYDVGITYGINPVYLMAKFGLESGWGTSQIFLKKNNVGGWRLNDGSYKTFNSVEESIDFIASKIAERYQGYSLKEICDRYCTDEGYYECIVGMMDTLNKEINIYRGI